MKNPTGIHDFGVLSNALTSEEKRGLYPKYTVIDNETGEEVKDFCFVLLPKNDPVAKKALLAYIGNTDNLSLAKDLFKVLYG